MEEKRKSLRLYHKEFQNFTVHVSMPGTLLAGFPGDIAEFGMSVLIPGTETLALPASTDVGITISSAHMSRPLLLSGRLVRQDVISLYNRDFRVLGIRFLERVEWPDAMIAVDMMATAG
ncbi:MAG: hypothetical protein KDK34_21850 [Leptospiraceae bacterium]|nr:hypothetical protein [Leptospiraceae bacterium]MCB1322915.1 hypothetical protein [Leptospiraceae bacterium]